MKQKPDLPFLGSHPYRAICGLKAPLFVAVLEVGDGYLCIEYQMGIDQVILFAAAKELFSWQYRRLEDDPTEEIQRLKARSMSGGITPEARLLLATLIPYTQEELNMAQANAKLAKKTAEAAAPAEKNTGNAAALAKAREARAANAGPDTRKVTVLKKDHGGRPGSKTAERYDKIIKSKTVQAGLDNEDGIKLTKADFNYAAEKGIISLG